MTAARDERVRAIKGLSGDELVEAIEGLSTEDELVRAVEGLSVEDVLWLIAALENRAEASRVRGLELQAEAESFHSAAEDLEGELTTLRRMQSELHVRWAITTLRFRERAAAARSRDDPTTIDESPVQPGMSQPAGSLRWPGLGPASVGGAVLLGWVAGIFGGPLLAIVGAIVGLLTGDVLDRRIEPERESTAA